MRLRQHQFDPYRLGMGIGFQEQEAIDLIKRFIDHIWSGDIAPAKIYLESGLPLTLSLAQSGEYALAMNSEEDMEEFVNAMSYIHDQAANMDF